MSGRLRRGAFKVSTFNEAQRHSLVLLRLLYCHLDGLILPFGWLDSGATTIIPFGSYVTLLLVLPRSDYSRYRARASSTYEVFQFLGRYTATVMGRGQV